MSVVSDPLVPGLPLTREQALALPGMRRYRLVEFLIRWEHFGAAREHRRKLPIAALCRGKAPRYRALGRKKCEARRANAKLCREAGLRGTHGRSTEGRSTENRRATVLRRERV